MLYLYCLPIYLTIIKHITISSTVSSSSNIINIPSHANLLSTSCNISIDSGVENAMCNYVSDGLTFIGPSKLNILTTLIYIQ